MSQGGNALASQPNSPTVEPHPPHQPHLLEAQDEHILHRHVSHLGQCLAVAQPEALLLRGQGRGVGGVGVGGDGMGGWCQLHLQQLIVFHDKCPTLTTP